MTGHDRYSIDPSEELTAARVPEGWTPETDAADPAWQAMSALLREADEPTRLPTRAEIDSAHARIMAALAEGERVAEDPDLLPVPAGPAVVLPAPSAKPPTARVIVLGGGALGQILRLAAVGALAFVLGSQIMGTDPATPPLAPAGDSPLVADVPVPRDASPPLPVADAGPLALPPDTWGEGTWRSGEVIFRSLHDDLSAYSSGPATSGGGMIPVSTSNNDWYVQSHFGRANPGHSYTARELVDAIQQLRVHAELTGDRQATSRVRQLEESLRPLLEESALVDAATARALSAIETGDRLTAAGRHADAIEAYREVATEAPQTSLAIAARLQMARLLFEELADYEQALDTYRLLLSDYPAHQFTPAQRDHVVQRIDLLTRNYADDWLAVRLWQEARRATGEARHARLEEILVRAARSPLAAYAAEELAADATRASSRLSPERIEALLRVMDGALSQSEGAPHGAAFQFAKAELTLLGLFDRDLATEEYRKVLRHPGAGEYGAAARSRLNQLQR